MLVYVPLYGTWWGMAVASEGIDPLALPEEEVDRRIAERALRNLRFYNGATHHAVMALPNFVREILDRHAAPVTSDVPLDDVPDPARFMPLELRPA